MMAGALQASPAPTALRGLLMWPCGSWRTFCLADQQPGRYLLGPNAGWPERSW